MSLNQYSLKRYEHVAHRLKLAWITKRSFLLSPPAFSRMISGSEWLQLSD